MGAGGVVVERRGPVLIVTMDREAKRNAVDVAMTAGLDAAFNSFDDDPSLRVAVLAARGPVFCAGTDLVEGAGEPTGRGGEYGFIRRRRIKPVIAAVEGAALGGGFELVLACDLVVASAGAYFALPEATRGRVANAGGLFRAADRLPRNVAMEMLLTGGRLTAGRAHQLGLVNRLADAGDGMTLDAAIALAHEVCGSAPGSIEQVLTAVEVIDAEAEATGWQVTAAARAVTDVSSDRIEGTAAFRERRPASWVVAPLAQP